MTPFEMDTDARARSVAKQLRANLSGKGIDLPLGKCRDATARLFGHANWRALTAALGRGRSPDDAHAPDPERAARHQAQREVLIGLGLPPEAAEDLRNALSPTGRTSEDAASSGPVILQHTGQYHPVRLTDVTESLAGGLAARMARGLKAFPSDDAHLSFGTDAIVETVMELADLVNVLPLDEEGMDHESYAEVHGKAQAIVMGMGTLLDASEQAAALALRDVSDETYTGAWDGMPPVYVHLGTNAFPSPFPHAGIEGCYVEISVPDGYGMCRALDVTFVASPEAVPGLMFSEAASDPRDEAYWALRTVTLITDIPEGEESLRLGDLLSSFNGSARSDAHVDLWRPYLAAPLNAAWNAIRAEREGTLPVRDGVVSDVDEDLVRKLARARTPAMRQRAVEAIADEAAEVVVRFLGGVPAWATEMDDVSIAPGVDADVDDPFEWAEAYFRLAEDAYMPEARLHFAERAMGILRDQAEGGGPEEYLRYHHLKELALSRRERWAEALAEAELCVDYDDEGVTHMPARVLALAVLAGDEKAGRKALSSGMADWALAWCTALFQARFGSQRARDRALAKAAGLHPGTAIALLSQPAGNERETSILDGGETTLAGLHRDAWESIAGYRELIMTAMPAVRA